MCDVERGAADVFAVADDAVFLREQGFGENRGHPQNGGKPHPKNRTRPACGNGGCHSGDVARADLGGDGNGECLELRQRFIVFVFFGKQAAKDGFETFAKFGNLRRTQIECEKQADAQKGVNQQVVPQNQIDCAHQCRQCFFHNYKPYIEK